MPKDVCPRCGSRLDCASHPADAQPGPGDMSVCLYCGAALVFLEDLRTRLATQEEIEETPVVKSFQAAVLRVRASGQPPPVKA